MQTHLPAHVNIGEPKVRCDPQPVAAIPGYIASPTHVSPASSMRFNVYEVLRTGQKILRIVGSHYEAIIT